VSLKLQSIADQIMPGLIPLLVVGFTWWLLGLKKMNSTRVIFVLIALGIIGYNLNILG
jgi:PTS system mannose-specific IID component